MPGSDKTTVLTIRVPVGLDRRVAQAARRKRVSKSALLREAIASAFGGERDPDDPAREARRQSLLVSGRDSERDILEFVDHVADDRAWR